ncbi:MAG: rhodanese-like domain-containing protein [Bryobacterales bacterium]|nr:rhodanese-like domain-containing protein [Bryobacterales bacterium]
MLRSDLRQKLFFGHVVVVATVRPDEFAAGAVSGCCATSYRVAIEQRLRGLPKDRDIVAYCRGPYCVLSDDAVALLRSKGRRAFRLEEGYPDWQAMGWPCERPATRSGAGA